ncbi:MAG: bis(5'-nucleosyl)-tetraphosphatase [Pseudomonadota bacterium]
MGVAASGTPSARAYTAAMLGKSQNSKRAGGVVVVRDTPHGVRYLLLRAYRNWDLPKGRLEPGESPFEAAVRETREETGLAGLEFAWGHEYVDTEPYAGGKVVRYFVARTATEAVILAVNPALGRPEHHEYRWLPLDTALALTVPRLQRVLRWAAMQIGDLQPVRPELPSSESTSG